MHVKSYICLGIAAASVSAAASSGHNNKHGVRVFGGSNPKGKKHRSMRSTPLSFDASGISMDEKITLCNDNSNFCNNVCLNMTWGEPLNSGCEATDLQWHCTCGNGKNPDPDIYTFPVMHFQCQQEVKQCQDNCATGDTYCTQMCQEGRNCTAPNDPNAGKTAEPETDVATDGLDSDNGNSNPINFFSSASFISTTGYVALTVLVATSLQMLGLP
ncbi:hypothetical protein GGI25_002923 [Coemansia spiralis]|uniref:DUF7707 domain-containing protein n=2 Tax=Coemansia TaxID=4863 RepID=A0A9W8G854_9FUNG|nr:hypothetical protein BX070DRAFT_233829 [Coemansia spiralis]KAJ1992394.1 hypothetical protein EDC05_002892 [Coemansia umbellata]KAJ2622223.1 hypothetical protein GGI26_003376 [Coemansia sp. RSA 1358]KAJ2677825.1 hypothetical protein GGI25_002923 [Coemansia spiralis]